MALFASQWWPAQASPEERAGLDGKDAVQPDPGQGGLGQGTSRPHKSTIPGKKTTCRHSLTLGGGANPQPAQPGWDTLADGTKDGLRHPWVELGEVHPFGSAAAFQPKTGGLMGGGGCNHNVFEPVGPTTCKPWGQGCSKAWCAQWSKPHLEGGELEPCPPCKRARTDSFGENCIWKTIG